jgi:putative FmdB family regulatory protein
MPTYTYKCESCGNAFDVVQSFSEKSLKKHPECGGTLRKVFHPAGIVFKGSGFYKTDSKKDAKPASKPAAKTETKKEPSSSKTDAPKKSSPSAKDSD